MRAGHRVPPALAPAVVFVEHWQQECCGQPFAVGARVRWSVTDVVDAAPLARALGPQTAARVTHVEDHHGQRPSGRVLVGTVERIDAAHCQDRPAAPNPLGVTHEPVPGTHRLRQVQEGRRDEPAVDDDRWTGYLVVVRPDEERGQRATR